MLPDLRVDCQVHRSFNCSPIETSPRWPMLCRFRMKCRCCRRGGARPGLLVIHLIGPEETRMPLVGSRCA